MRKGKKITGGRYKKGREKKLYEIPGKKRIVKLGEEKNKVIRVRGGNKKSILLKIKYVNVRDDNKNKRLEIKNVVETPSNRFLARQNIVTKGAIVETELGKVKITNRPSQEGMANGVMIKE